MLHVALWRRKMVRIDTLHGEREYLANPSSPMRTLYSNTTSPLNECDVYGVLRQYER